MNAQLKAAPTTVRHILAADPVWSAYAMADLQPNFAPHCRWYTAQTERGDGLVLIYTGLEPPILLTVGEPGAVEQALSQIDLPGQVYLSIRDEHEPVVTRWYDVSKDRRPMYRLGLPGDVTFELPRGASLNRLTRDDAPRLRKLYAHGGDFAPDAFDPYQIDNGIFWGVEAQSGDLIAAGGTHIVDWQQGIAAIGNMYTLPNHRGMGHAGYVLQALVASLRECDVETIVLNVDQRNAGARRLYERHGFVVHCSFIEGTAARRDA